MFFFQHNPGYQRVLHWRILTWTSISHGKFYFATRWISAIGRKHLQYTHQTSLCFSMAGNQQKYEYSYKLMKINWQLKFCFWRLFDNWLDARSATARKLSLCQIRAVVRSENPRGGGGLVVLWWTYSGPCLRKGYVNDLKKNLSPPSPSLATAL